MITALEFQQLIQPDVQAALLEYANADPKQLAMQAHRFPDWPIRAMAEQLDCRRRARQKLPDWNVDQLLYDKQGIQQCSHGRVAQWRANQLAGQRIWDVCGGLGIDALAMAQAGAWVSHCELDPDRARLAAWNHRDRAIAHHSGDGVQALDQPVDLVFIDPSRRDARGRRAVDLHRLEPEPMAVQDHLLRYGARLQWKLAPATDAVEILRHLQQVRNIAYISVDGEGKECQVYCHHGDAEPERRAVLIGESIQELCGPRQPPLPSGRDAREGDHLLVADPAVVCAGLGGLLTTHCCGQHPGLLLAEQPLPTFGKRWQVAEVLPSQLKALRKHLKQRGMDQAHLLLRWPGELPSDIGKRLALRPGGDAAILLYQGLRGRQAALLHADAT
jgi:predicted O-methyltransferase YrrM